MSVRALKPLPSGRYSTRNSTVVKHPIDGQDLPWTPELGDWLVGKTVLTKHVNCDVMMDDGVTPDTAFAYRFAPNSAAAVDSVNKRNER